LRRPAYGLRPDFSILPPTMNNKLHYSFLLCLAVIGLLLLLSWLPKFSWGPFILKKVDLFSDIRTPAPVPDSLVAETEIADSVVVKQDSIVHEIQEHCKPGITCIEDYSNDSSALKYFFRALQQTKSTGTRVRVAFYGDSFIEGDVFCGSFRDTLQSIFGGKGVGFVPITSDVAGFRKTVKHRFDHWRTSSLIVRRDSTAQIGPAGFCFIPQENNWVEYQPVSQRYLREFNMVKLYYKNAGHNLLHATFDTLSLDEPLETSNALQEWSFKKEHIRSVRFEFYPADSLWVYGASFEDGPGIYVDNFSLRGNSGMNLAAISSDMYKQFNRYRDYKLIILQFGLNLIVEENLNYRTYTKRMVNVVNTLKKNFPQASFLLLSISDRSGNVEGEYRTMRAVPAMRNAQRLIAQETGIAFWDMFEAMGGEDSMVKYAEADPPLAAKDYTHLNFKGGKKLSGSLVKSLVYEMEKRK
jgi:lysophospholipase L1-like esterase